MTYATNGWAALGDPTRRTIFERLIEHPSAVGELARAVRKGTAEQQLHELGDVLAWLASLADQLGLSLADAAARYAQGCPRCGGIPCACA